MIMKKLFLALPVLLFVNSVVLAGEVREALLFSADKLPMNYSFTGTKAKRLIDPSKGGVLSFTLPPDTFGKDKSKRPEVLLEGKALLLKQAGDYDEVVLTAYNPSDKPVNLVICFAGRHAKNRHYKGFKLQPRAWSRNLFDVARVKKVTANRFRAVRIFNTNPQHSVTFLLKSLKLVKSRLSDTQKLNKSLPLADFRNGRLSKGWETISVNSKMCEKNRPAKGFSIKTSFPVYHSGESAWPALQFWTGAGAVPTDWSLFSNLSFTFRNPGSQMIPLKMLLQDAKGNRRSFGCLLPAGQTMTHRISLRNLGGFDVSRVRQIDFFMHKPSENYQFYCDDIRLNTISDEDIKRWCTTLDKLEQELEGLAAPRRKYYVKKIDDNRKRLAKYQLVSSGQLSVAQLREISSFGEKLSAWLNNGSRELSTWRIIAKTRKKNPQAPFGVAVADSMTKVMIVDRPLTNVRYQDSVKLALAKNEYESTQVVIVGAEAPKKVKVTTGKLKSKNGVEFPAKNISTCVVGYVKTGMPFYKADYNGWWPDPLLEYQKTAKVKPGETVPFWIRVKTPKNIPADTYYGDIKIESEDGIIIKLPMELRVFDFTLPTRSPLKIAANFNLQTIKRFWDPKITNEQIEEKLDKIANTLIDYKIGLDSIYRRSFGHPKELKLYLRQLRTLKKRNLLTYFNICYIGGVNRTVTDVNHPSVAKSIKNALDTIRYWKPILQKEGLWEYAQVYGFDEMPTEAFPVVKKIFGAVKKEFPDLPIATTAYDHSLGTKSVLGSVVDIFIPLTSRFDQATVKKSRSMKHKIWWYICVIPHAPYANWLIEYPAIDARILMGAMTYMYRPDGFLYYSLTGWKGNRKPLSEHGPYTKWNPASYKTANGDGYLFYPGESGLLPSVRAENFRDGLEDYSYFLILEKLLKTPEARQEYSQVLAIQPSLVASLKEFTKDPALLRRKRLQLANAIEKILHGKSSKMNK